MAFWPMDNPGATLGFHQQMLGIIVNIGKMHTIPYDAKAGFHERFIVENKDRYLEGRWYFDEWDKALASRGLKNKREQYRMREDYHSSLGATWDLPPNLQSDNFVGDKLVGS